MTADFTLLARPSRPSFPPAPELKLRTAAAAARPPCRSMVAMHDVYLADYVGAGWGITFSLRIAAWGLPLEEVVLRPEGSSDACIQEKHRAQLAV